jgi:pyruvate kinase
MTNYQMTKIVATLGPASSSVEKLKELIYAGVRVFRINFSHGTFKEYDEKIRNIRIAEKATGIYVAILGDLSGPKIRVGKVIQEGVILKEKQILRFVDYDVVGGSEGNEYVFSTTYPQFISEVRPGEKILLDDGNIELKAINKGKDDNGKWLDCEVVEGNLLTSSKGINLPDSQLTLPSMTDKDFKCVEYAVINKFHFLALSFVRSSKDVKVLKEKLYDLGAHPKGGDLITRDMGFSDSVKAANFIPIISKIEKPQAIDNLEEIVKESEGIMVARGDLGVEMDLSEVSILQKRIIEMCKNNGRYVIVATQMLQSMIEEPVPTRAEVSDVANAILDGADATMLSGETAVGKHPVKAVGMMQKIISKTSEYLRQQKKSKGLFIENAGMINRKEAIARGVKMIANDIGAKFIVTWTQSGGSTAMLSLQKMLIPIISFGDDIYRLQQMSALYSVIPVFMEQPKSGSEFILTVDNFLIDNNMAQKGDHIIIVASSPITIPGITNRMIIHIVGEVTNV